MVQQRGTDSQPAWAALETFQPFEPTHTVENGAVSLQNMTELSFAVPPNTTLLRVLGPVRDADEWDQKANCYAALDPEPSWWKPSNFPLSTSYKPNSGSNRTLFLLPIDPTVEFTLRLGPPNPASKCVVDGIQSYPFYLYVSRRFSRV